MECLSVKVTEQKDLPPLSLAVRRRAVRLSQPSRWHSREWVEIDSGCRCQGWVLVELQIRPQGPAFPSQPLESDKEQACRLQAMFLRVLATRRVFALVPRRTP